jgi:hypothetical protein
MQDSGVDEHPPEPEDSGHRSSPDDSRKDAVSKNVSPPHLDVQTAFSKMLDDAKLTTAAMKAFQDSGAGLTTAAMKAMQDSNAKLTTAAANAIQNMQAAAGVGEGLARQMSRLTSPSMALFDVPSIKVPSFDPPLASRENEVSRNKETNSLRTWVNTKVDELGGKLDDLSEKYDGSVTVYNDLAQKYDDLAQKYRGLEGDLDAKIEELGKFQDQTTELQEKMQQKTEHFESQLAGTEHRSIEVVGLLSSIVALVLVSATTANSQSSPVSAYLIIVVAAAGLAVFACLLHAFFQPSSPRPFWRYWLPFALIPALAVVAAGLLLFWTTYIGVLL